jgi:hypothetical protein
MPPPHAPQMPRIFPTIDEIRQCDLFSHAPLPRNFAERLVDICDEVCRHDHKAHPQRRKHRLAEGAEVNHRRVGREPLDRRQRRTAVAQLAVVVVFDDPGAARHRVLDDRPAPLQAQHAAERILMRRRDVHQAWRRLVPVIGRRRHPGGIDGNRHQFQTSGLKRSLRAVIAGVLDPDAVAGVGQHARA